MNILHPVWRYLREGRHSDLPGVPLLVQSAVSTIPANLNYRVLRAKPAWACADGEASDYWPAMRALKNWLAEVKQ